MDPKKYEVFQNSAFPEVNRPITSKKSKNKEDKKIKKPYSGVGRDAKIDPDLYYRIKEENEQLKKTKLALNQKITKLKSTRCASVKPIDTSNNYCTNYSTKLKKKIENVSFIGLRNNDSKKIFEPRKYKGPVDLKCLLIAHSVNLLIEKISTLLRKNKISKTFINPYRMRCNKGGEIFDIEIMCLNENPLRINYNKGINEEFMNYKRTSYNPENDIKYKTITESKNEKNPMLYYFTMY